MGSRWAGGRTEAFSDGVTNRATPNIGLYVGATVLAIFHPNAAAGLYLVIALVTVARARGDTPAHDPEASRPPEPGRQQNSSSLSPGRRVRVPPSSSS